MRYITASAMALWMKSGGDIDIFGHRANLTIYIRTSPKHNEVRLKWPLCRTEGKTGVLFDNSTLCLDVDICSWCKCTLFRSECALHRKLLCLAQLRRLVPHSATRLCQLFHCETRLREHSDECCERITRVSIKHLLVLSMLICDSCS